MDSAHHDPPYFYVCDPCCTHNGPPITHTNTHTHSLVVSMHKARSQRNLNMHVMLWPRNCGRLCSEKCGVRHACVAVKSERRRLARNSGCCGRVPKQNTDGYTTHTHTLTLLTCASCTCVYVITMREQIAYALAANVLVVVIRRFSRPISFSFNHAHARRE